MSFLVFEREDCKFDYRVYLIYIKSSQMGRVGNPDLKLVNLYLLKQDIASARREARRRGIGYQQVIRGWVSDGATRTEVKRG